jgi:hypothetical protein
VSLFRRERVYASIELDRIALVKLGGKHADTPTQEQLIDVDFDPDHPERALREVSNLLASPGWRGTRRHVVLSDRLARYLVIERPEGIRSFGELDLAVSARFEEAFDASSAHWDIAIDARTLAQRFFACATPRRVLQEIRNTFSENGECDSIRPYLVCELNRLARRIPASCWFATATRDSLGLAGVSGGEVRQIRVLPCSSPASSTIAELVERERLLAGEAAGGRECLFSGVLEDDDERAMLTRLDQPQWGAQHRAWSSNYRVALAEIWPSSH